MKHLLQALAKSVLVPLESTATASSTDAATQRNICGSRATTSIFLLEDLNDIMKIVKSLKGSNLLLKSVNKTVKKKAK